MQGGISDIQRLDKDILQRVMDLLRAAQLLLLHALAELFDNLCRGFHADIREDHALLQLLVEFLVCSGEGVKQSSKGRRNCISRFL